VVGFQEHKVKLISVNVGRPRKVEWHGRQTRTSIWKSPVEGRVQVKGVNLDGDDQSDRRVHGGRDKAVYAYPSEHYEHWSRELPGVELPWGVFGENFTISGLLEGDVKVGDRLRIGSAEFSVTQPRVPCFKLELRFGRKATVQQFFESGRTGFYLAIVREGEVGQGDDITHVPGANADGSIAELFALYGDKTPDRKRLTHAIELAGLSDAWRDHFRTQLAALKGDG
jgi:MOSC domain-containing protein YiiM